MPGKIPKVIFFDHSYKVFNYYRQTIRETWGNNSEFNYPYFEKFHSALSGRYLTPNYKYWKNYSVPVLLEVSAFKQYGFNLFKMCSVLQTSKVLKFSISIMKCP